jgi:hypothetical protein
VTFTQECSCCRFKLVQTYSQFSSVWPFEFAYNNLLAITSLIVKANPHLHIRQLPTFAMSWDQALNQTIIRVQKVIDQFPKDCFDRILGLRRTTARTDISISVSDCFREMVLRPNRGGYWGKTCPRLLCIAHRRLVSWP